METQNIFLSYSRDDSEFVLKLAKDLRAAGANIWLDQLDIPTGNRWDLAIEEALTSANRLIVILSESSVASNNVMDEVSYALERGKRIFPVVLNECNVPFRLKRLQFIDFTVDYDKGLARLLTDLSIGQSSIIGNSSPDKQPILDVPVTHTRKKESRIKIGIWGNGSLLKWVSICTLAVVIVFIILYKFVPLNLDQSQKNVDNLQIIRVWKVGSPHEGDIPDSTPPFELQRESKKMGFKLSVEGFPAKGFASKFFEAVEKHEEPDILVIDNYGIIDGITTALGNFTGIGTSSIIRDNLVSVSGSLKEFESSQGGWQILISTSRNYREAKALALRQSHCDPELKVTLEKIEKTIAGELHKYALKYISDSNMFPVRLGSDFSMTICGFWGNNNIAFINSNITYEAEKNIGWSKVLVMMEKKESSWELLNLGGNVDLIKQLNKQIKLVDASPNAALQNDLKIIGPPDGTKSTRTSKPSLEWEWSSDVKNIAYYLIESQYSSDDRWSWSYFKLILPQKNVKLVAPFGVGMQPHRWKVWAIDQKGSVVRSSWSTINYTD